MSKNAPASGNNDAINNSGANSNDLIRSFYPISRIDQLGSFDLLIKILKDPNTGAYLGKFSEIVETCQVGEHFQLTGQDFRYKYNGFGEIEIKSADGSIKTVKDIRSLVMLAQNTNISTFFQLIDTVARYGLDPINLSLLYTVNDMVNSLGSRSIHRGVCCFERG